LFQERRLSFRQCNACNDKVEVFQVEELSRTRDNVLHEMTDVIIISMLISRITYINTSVMRHTWSTMGNNATMRNLAKLERSHAINIHLIQVRRILGVSRKQEGTTRKRRENYVTDRAYRPARVCSIEATLNTCVSVEPLWEGSKTLVLSIPARTRGPLFGLVPFAKLVPAKPLPHDGSKVWCP